MASKNGCGKPTHVKIKNGLSTKREGKTIGISISIKAAANGMKMEAMITMKPLKTPKNSLMKTTLRKLTKKLVC